MEKNSRFRDKTSTSGPKPSHTVEQLYRERLNAKEKERYLNKLKLIGDEDPYDMDASLFSGDLALLPPISYPDIVNYLVFSPSPYTAKDLKSYKGLEAYNQFVCGWVRDRKARKLGEKHLVMAKVLHSQRLSEKPLLPWVIADEDGNVLAAHCTCMAGLGEVCTHVAAVLFSIDASVRLYNAKTVTEVKACWMPSSIKNVEYKPVAEINFTSAKALKKNLDSCIDHMHTPQSSSLKKQTCIPAPSDIEMSTFFTTLHSGPTKPAILSIIPPFAESYVPKSLNENFPKVLTELFSDSSLSLGYTELVEAGHDVDFTVSENEVKLVERSTQGQSKSKLWYRFRAGRITASKMKDVCSTNSASPSLSLIKSICYPQKFSTVATAWGCQHEKHATEVFAERMQSLHENFQILPNGFFISKDYPFIGASPDCIASCNCCGKSVVEVKCPFCVKDKSLADGASTPRFCLKDDNGQLTLDNKHKYFYQVQTQMAVCRLEHAYFVVWTENDLHIEQIFFDSKMWSDIIEKARHVFHYGVLPELIGKYFTRLPNSVVSDQDPNNNEHNVNVWCLCRKGESGDMIGCDSKCCKIQWFHYECVGVVSCPKGKWFCPECRKSVKKSKSSKK